MENRPDNEKGIEPQVEPVNPAEPVEHAVEEPEEEQRPKGIAAVFREAFQRARHGQKRGSNTRPKTNPAVSDRTARNRDRTKTLFVSVVGLVAVLIIFLGVFSSSHTNTKQAAKRNPSLGRPEDQGRQRTGSVTPLLNAEMNGQDLGNGQLTPDDINNTSRPRAAADAAASKQKAAPSARASAKPRGAGPNTAQALDNVPFTDPALEAYRRQMQTAGAAVPAVTASASTPASSPAISESDALGKASLVYVRTNANSGTPAANGAQLLPAVATADPAFLDRKVWSGLPTGTRLVARLQTAVSTAVKAPVVAVIETHYERDGEIVLPAGTKAFGELESGTHSGHIGIRFHTLQMPDGTTEKIEAGAMSLSFGPLKGQVTGRNRGKQFLARAVTGVGTVAAFAVGHPGGLTGSMDNSILLRDRISQNIGMAGEQEVMNLAYSPDIVVTVPGNTRFFIVLEQGTGQEGAKPQLVPAGSSGRGSTAVASNGQRPELPTAAELRELVSLKQELNRIYGEAAATRTTAPAGTPER